MSVEILHYSFQSAQIRSVLIDGQPWFVARDVAQVLGYSDLTNAIKAHAKGVANHHPLQTSGGTQQVRIINEADVMRMIVSSKLPAAEQFEKWVFEEVLPQIRKTGSYGVQHQIPQTYADALTLAASQAKQMEALEAQRAEDAPKVLLADSIATSNTTILVGELAKILRGNGVDVGEKRLFEWLRTDGFLIKRQGSDWNMPTQRAMDMGLFKIKETAITRTNGVSISKTPKVTGKGQLYFVNRYRDQAVAVAA